MSQDAIESDCEKWPDAIPDEIENGLCGVGHILRSDLVDVDETGAGKKGVADAMDSESDENQSHRNSNRSEKEKPQCVGTNSHEENGLEPESREKPTENHIHHDLANLPDGHGR